MRSGKYTLVARYPPTHPGRMDNDDMLDLEDRLKKWRLAAHYATTITEPLLTLTARVQYEDDFARAYRNETHWARMVLAGALSDLVRTLATKDGPYPRIVDTGCDYAAVGSVAARRAS